MSTPAPAPFPTQDPPPPPYTGPTRITPNQHKFCFSTVRTLKRLKDAAPFLRPVAPAALNIPHYPLIIKRPMDFSTVETRLQNSNPNKPPVDPLAPRYRTTDDFVADVRQIFQNCYLFNGTEHFISHQARKLEDILDKQLKQMPPDEEPAARYESPPQPKKPSVPPARRQSTSVPTIRRNTPDDFPSPVARPKREIHPPPPKDLSYSDLPNGKRARKGKSRGAEPDDGTADQMRHCMKILTDFNKKSLYQIASPFYEPVDVAFVPTYYKVIKRPMDLGTMRKKLDEGNYPNAHAFHNDFRLMIKNCMIFNPPGTAVHNAGLEMDRIFKEKWKNLPPLRQLSLEDDQAADSSEDEHAGEDDLAIAMMESQIETMKGSLALLKAKKSQKPKAAAAATIAAPPPKDKKSPVAPPKKPARKPSTSTYAPPYAPPAPGPSKAKPAPAPKPAKNGASGKKNKGGTGSDTERSISIMSFEQKKELSTTIESLDGDKLEKVIQIIYEGMPDLQNSNEEIELDIESLTPAVLTKLWNFVVKPQHQKKSAVSSNGPKRTSGNASKGAAATGGVKRKSMDEAAESERIRKLEAQINQFGKPPGADARFANDNFDDDAHSSGASASESDSGSDSD
ncbi:hypothetical protein FS749_006399 [Ceratobasidium sp. UAMH 11750]|nr:hypothetical protein FS749_006399 [Ceratobasidium sp. UAMH 11750]